MDNSPPSTPRAYVAAESSEYPRRYSGYVEQSDGTNEYSPTFGILSDAVDWARARTSWVIARDTAGDYFWYGSGEKPPGIAYPPEGSHQGPTV